MEGAASAPNLFWPSTILPLFIRITCQDKWTRPTNWRKRRRDAAPDEPHIADTLGWILFKKGEYRNALPLLQESALKLPQANVQYHLGMAYYMLGEEASAREALQKAVDAKLDSVESDEARKRLALLAIDPRTAEPAARDDLAKILKGST